MTTFLRRHVFILKDQVSFDQVLALFHLTLHWSFVFVCIKIHWMHALHYTKENYKLSTLVERWITGSQRWIHVSFLLSFFYLILFHPGDFSNNSKRKEKYKLLIYITFSFFYKLFVRVILFYKEQMSMGNLKTVSDLYFKISELVKHQ